MYLVFGKIIKKIHKQPLARIHHVMITIKKGEGRGRYILFVQQ